MSDKEPRRRKKRKDQLKKDDVQFEETSFVPQKQESRDSDQETEDDHFVATQHQPSKIAKIIFMLLFSTLVVTMSFVFIALRGAERGPVDIFDMDHHESAVEVDVNHEEDVEILNISDQYADKQYEDAQLTDSIETLEHTEAPDLEEELVSKVFYKSEENGGEINLETVSEAEEDDDGQFEAVHSWHGDTDEDLPDEDAHDSRASESSEAEESSSKVEDGSAPEPQHSVYDELGTEEEELETELPVTDSSDAEESLEKYYSDDDSSQLGSVDVADSNMHEEVIDTEEHTNDAEPSPPPYEKIDVTNEEDFNIKEELDDIDSILDKDDVDDDDDVDEGEEEFDFWHF